MCAKKGERMADKPNGSPKSDTLNSWKEIAHYLDRGVRTVQRWEQDLGLPVRRPRGKGRSAVIAVRQDVDAWVKSRPIAYGLRRNGATCREAILRSQGLRRATTRLCTEMAVVLDALASNVNRLRLSDGGAGEPDLSRPSTKSNPSA